jgi:hypothetical protein
MTPTESAAILRQHNAWRRHDGDEPMEMQSPRLIGEAIDVAVKYITQAVTMEEVLRQIAGMKRRTKEQRLANACVTFFDAVEDHK